MWQTAPGVVQGGRPKEIPRDGVRSERSGCEAHLLLKEPPRARAMETRAPRRGTRETVGDLEGGSACRNRVLRCRMRYSCPRKSPPQACSHRGTRAVVADLDKRHLR